MVAEGAIAVARGVLGHVFASTWVALELLHSPFLLLREILFKRLFVIETLGLLSLIVGALLTTWLLTPIFSIRIPIHKLDREFDHARSFETAPNRRFIGSWFRRHPWAIPSWVSEPDFERVAWVGDALSLYWPALRQSLRRKIYTVMDKVLHEKLLKKLKLQHLVPRGFTWNIDVDIGSVPLRLGGIKTHGQGRMNQSIIVEAQVMWGSEKLNVKTALQYVTDSGIKFYFPILAISDLILSGPVRVTFHKLVPHKKLCRNLTVSLVKTPQIAFDVCLFGIFRMNHIPGLGMVVLALTRFILMRFLGLPRDLKINMAPPPWPENPVGILRIRNIQIRKFKAPSFSLFDMVVDPFCVLATSVGGQSEKFTLVSRRQTPMVMNKSTYRWEGEYLIPVFSRELHSFHFACYDSDPTQNELLLSRSFPIDQESDIGRAASEGRAVVFEFDQRLKKRKKTGGTASLEVKYIPLHEPTAEEKEAARSPTAPSGALSLNKGNLTVYVESGSDLAKQANVRCRIRLQTVAGMVLAEEITGVEVNTRTPVFMETFDFCYVDAGHVLLLEVERSSGEDSTKVTKNASKISLGYVKIAVEDITATGKLRESFNLHGVGQGTLTVTLSWSHIWPSAELDDMLGGVSDLLSPRFINSPRATMKDDRATGYATSASAEETHLLDLERMMGMTDKKFEPEPVYVDLRGKEEAELRPQGSSKFIRTGAMAFTRVGPGKRDKEFRSINIKGTQAISEKARLKSVRASRKLKKTLTGTPQEELYSA